MNSKSPKVYLCILVIKENKILLGLLTKDWLYEGRQVYGVPGRDLNFREKFGSGIKRILREELGVGVATYKIISINANYEYGNHYVGVGAVAEIDGEVKLQKPKDWEKWDWFDLDKIPQNLFPAARDIIKCFLENKVCVSE